MAFVPHISPCADVADCRSSEERRSAPPPGAMTRWPSLLLLLLSVAAAFRTADTTCDGANHSGSLVSSSGGSSGCSDAYSSVELYPADVPPNQTPLVIGYMTAIKGELKDRQGLAISGALTMALDEVSG